MILVSGLVITAPDYNQEALSLFSIYLFNFF
jgi:hypothetical protein